ncbi:flavin-containing monooxygenase [Rhizorhabdus argentea]|uniref:flavin-containing monooxygenase n=1 Tax=Rhizorhabdus argentea TaxID=1387174 RepID=UPI0030EBCF35
MKSRDAFDFDPEALLQKYAEERTRRIRSDGTQQYIKIEGRYAHYLEDPYVERIEREAIEEELDVVVLGGGFGGLLAGARLRARGVTDVRLIEKGGDFGGTWYWNRYPGAACDVESYNYMPLLEETGYMPVEKYGRAPEILEHSRRIGREFGLYEKALFQTEVTEARWHGEKARWLVSTDRGDRLWARFLITASGPLQEPKLPGIDGVESFKGHSFHTSRWDYNYTGGTSLGGLDKLADKTIAIIGTGATAVQCVPHLGTAAKQLYVFQRTPSSIGYRNDRPTDPEWAKTLTPGWQQRRMNNYTAIVSGMPMKEDLVDDGWTKIMHDVMSKATADTPPEEIGRMFQMADFAYMEDVRNRVDKVVKDPETAAALKPWYARMCKRPCFHDDYLETFNRSNVKLVDTAGRGVDRITKDALIVGDQEYKVDCIVYATGFALSAYLDGEVMPIYGRDGLQLTEKWKEGATTLHGIHVHGFPNYFILSTTQTAWGPNFPHMMNEQAIHIAYVIGEAKKRDLVSLEVQSEAESNWVQHHLDVCGPAIQMWKTCTPSFWNEEGQATSRMARNGMYGPGVFVLTDILEKWRVDGSLAGLDTVKRLC